MICSDPNGNKWRLPRSHDTHRASKLETRSDRVQTSLVHVRGFVGICSTHCSTVFDEVGSLHLFFLRA